MTIDALTGIGSNMDTDGSRRNAQQRTPERLEGVDVDAVRREAADTIVVETGKP